MEANGWQLYQHPLFKSRYEELLAEVERLAESQPDIYQNNKATKLLKRITSLIMEEIPSDPRHERFQQGKTLGSSYKHWKRAKFGRYRLYFRYEQKQIENKVLKVIIYAWINDEKTLRKAGDKNEPYAIFFRSLQRGRPPDSIDALLKESERLKFARQQSQEEVDDNDDAAE